MENANIVEALLKATRREEDTHIVVFPCSDRWAAIGQDADRIFELFGWQTGYVLGNDGTAVSWMFISTYGFEVLKNSDYSLQLRDYGEFDVLSHSYTEDAVSSLQQYVDYQRMRCGFTNEMQEFMQKTHHLICSNNGYDVLMEGSIKFSQDKVFFKKSDGETILLADGRNWRLDELGRSLLGAFNEKSK